VEVHRRLDSGSSEGPPDVTGGICQPGEFSTMGFILLSPKEAAIKTLFSQEMAAGAELDTGSLLASFVIVWVTTILTFGSAMPVGLFIPNILAGACLGNRAWTILALMVVCKGKTTPEIGGQADGPLSSQQLVLL
jgi:hypothetical protein